MSVEITDSTSGIVTVKVAGKLAQPDIARAQQQAIGIIARQGKIRLLVIVESFQGWEKGGDWSDVSFQSEYDEHIERMAVVGEKRWEEMALIFVGKGFREFPIEYFQPGEVAKARAWLAENR
jgi:hypothetical protein